MIQFTVESAKVEWEGRVLKAGSETYLFSDGTTHVVNYWIGEDTGFIGASWGVEWCVVGLDRNWAYNPRCKMAKP